MNQSTSGNTLIALALIGCGGLFLLSALFGFNLFSVIWPFFIILPGLPFIYFAFDDNRDLAWLMIPGALVTGTGLIFLYQSMFNHFESWAYAWALYGVFLGGSLMYAARRNEENEIYQLGYMMAVASGIGFVVMGAFFELLVFGGFVRRFLIAGIMIAVGVYLLLRDREDSAGGLIVDKPKRKRRVPWDDDPGYFLPRDEVAPSPTVRSRLQDEIDAAVGKDEPDDVEGPESSDPTGPAQSNGSARRIPVVTDDE